MIEDLRAFVAVADERSVTRAAERLCLTQSAVSRRIQQLEATLNAVLLDRTSRPPSLTLLGSRVYEHALRVVRDVDGLLLLPKRDAEPTGAFRLGVSHALTEVVSLPTVQGLKAHFPLLQIRLKTGWSASLQESINAQQLDAAIALFGRASAPSFPAEGQRVGEIDVAIIQSRRKALIRRKASLGELSAHSWILNPLGCGYRAELARVLGAAGRDLQIAVDTHGAELQLNMIASGVGLGLAPPILLRTSAFRDKIQIVDVPNFPLRLEAWVMYSREVGNMSRAISLVSKIVGTVLA